MPDEQHNGSCEKCDGTGYELFFKRAFGGNCLYSRACDECELGDRIWRRQQRDRNRAEMGP